MQLRLTFYVALALPLACGKPDAESASADTTSPSSTTSATTADSDTDASADTTAPPTTGEPATSTAPATSDDGHSTSTTASGSTSDAGATTGEPATSTTDTTTGVAVDFERFRLGRAAGPCPPNADCDGFIELLADGLLRVEPFGEVGDPVTEVQIDPADLDAAVPVFTDPDLLVLLDGPDPACDPPTDIFEDMLSAIGGTEHQAATTLCDQPPIAAARDMANMLRDKYAP